MDEDRQYSIFIPKFPSVLKKQTPRRNLNEENSKNDKKARVRRGGFLKNIEDDQRQDYFT